MIDIADTIVSNLVNVISGINESSYSSYDYPYDTMEYSNNNTSSFGSGDSQHLSTILQQLFSKMSDDETISKTSLNSNLSSFPTSLLSFETLLPSSANNPNSYRFLSFISFWFVLFVNPIVILFGVTGNLFATYILIRCNIAKLPVSFYTIMLNISDTLNLLIPVLIFWLDNCINRTPERGYFRDRSNFLCKALMCPDQLFAALSAWYMCAISFNRWYSVCRPSSYFFRAATSGTGNNNTSDADRGHKNYSSASTIMSKSANIPFNFPFDCCYCLARNIKFRQHLKAFRSIGFITLMGILSCLYPIFMHELRVVISTNEHVFDLKHKTTHTYSVVWKRCYYSQKHEYSYDIIGIILSCFLHILPLTFVAVMNIMIIIQLKKRQRLMTISTNLLQSQALINKKKKSSTDLHTRTSYTLNSSPERQTKYPKQTRLNAQPKLITNRKDQATSTDLLIQTPHQSTITINTSTPKRHHSRDRAITIMLVSVALSYLILTLPYRLFWSYNVYIKRMHPDKLNSSIYLLKMHYIDHILRTIRNIHYGTNFVFFIFLSKTFRRKFRQLFIEKIFQATNRLLNRKSTIIDTNDEIKSKMNHLRSSNFKLENKQTTQGMNSNYAGGTDYGSRSLLEEIPSFIVDARNGEDGIVPIGKLEYHNWPRYDGK